MKLLFLVSLEIRDFHGHVEEWGVYALTQAEAIIEAEKYGRVLSCRKIQAVIGED